MAIVADTSQINYLVLIDQIEILPRLYTRVLIPVKINTFMRHDCNTSVEQ
jgi:predicted nucleic acid-binding protein